MVWLVDERWAFRFPRRAIAIPGVERELVVLPLLAPLLPLQVPEPVFRGRPAEGYPWPFFGARFLPGREVADEELSDADRIRLARPLGAFLRALHEAEVAHAPPADPLGRGDMARRVPWTADRLAEVERLGLGLWRPPASVAAVPAAAGRPGELLEAYGPVREEQLLRARLLAIFLCAILAVYGRVEGQPNVEREAVGGLARSMEE